MRYADPILATAAGAAVFAVLTAGVSTALSSVVEASLLVAIPAALGVGMATMTAVYVGLADEAGTRHYAAALATGAFGVTFLATFGVAVAVGYPVGQALAFGVGAGLLAAGGVAVGSS